MALTQIKSAQIASLEWDKLTHDGSTIGDSLDNLAAACPETGTANGNYKWITYQEFNSKEDHLGDPGTDGWVLSSTVAGVRSWVAPTVNTNTEYTLVVQAGTLSGSTLTISGATPVGSVVFTINGVVMSPGTDYTVSSDEITIATTHYENGDNYTISYLAVAS